MDAGAVPMSVVFAGNKLLEIPFFQRSYVWGEEQWEQLLNDLEEVCRTGDIYFIGSIILKQQVVPSTETIGDVRIIIDGQQRLTTLSIFMKVLCLKTNKLDYFNHSFRLRNNEIMIKHNYNDIEAYNEIMALTQIVPTDRNDRISRCYQYFVDNLDPDKVDFDTIMNAVYFVSIDLGHNEDEQQIFDTINSLGVRLTTAELLKNYFFGRDDQEYYVNYWRNVFEKDEDTINYWDQESTTGRLRRTFIDMFFYSYLLIKIQDRSIGVTAEDKKRYSKAERVFDSYKNFIENYQEDKYVILKELAEYANEFRNAFNFDILEKELPAEPGIERLNALIFALDTATLIPYVLFIEHNVPNKTDRIQIYEHLESFIMRRLVLEMTTKNYNNLFYESLILNQVLSKAALVEYLDGQADNVNRMPSDVEVQDAFHTKWLINRYSLGVLYMIESKIRNRNFHATQLLGIKKYSLEHMMPKKWRNNWKFSGSVEEADERDKILLTLGNLTIITQSLNASISDADWATKKAGKGNRDGLSKYAEGIETLYGALDLDEWNEAAIYDRAEHLASAAVNTWKER